MTTAAETNDQKSGAKPRYDQRFVRRGPLEITAGMIRVRVQVQREKDGLWYAVVGTTIRNGSTRQEAIRSVLEASSVPPNAK